MILGYSEAIARIAHYGSASQLSDIHPRFVLLGGELSTPLMRRRIFEAFQAPVYQVYASTEFNLIGWSCPQSGLLHIFDPTVLVEVLDQQGKPVAAGESGQIVVTALHSRLMPFIRFELADRVVKGPTPCPCGAPYGTLQSIDGREMDRVRLSNGEYLHGYILLNQILQGDNSWVRQYQLVQEEAGVIEMHIWPLRAPDPAVIAFLKTRMEEKTAGTEVRIKLVEGMELDANGKFHLCRCSV
jgi:phenylacetate-CoA ligase